MKVPKKLSKKMAAEMAEWVASNIEALGTLKIELENAGLNSDANEVQYKIDTLYRFSKWTQGQWILFFHNLMF